MKTRRICAQPGCPNFQPCTTHVRPGPRQRGYDRQHDKARARWAGQVKAGVVKCWRCGEYIAPDEAWDLGHIDSDTYGGPEHMARCNRSAAGKAAHEQR